MFKIIELDYEMWTFLKNIVFWLVLLEKCSSLKCKIIYRTFSWSKQSWHDFSCLVRFPDKVYFTTAHDNLLHLRPKFLVNIKLFVSFPGKIWFTKIKSSFWLISNRKSNLVLIYFLVWFPGELPKLPKKCFLRF